MLSHRPWLAALAAAGAVLLPAAAAQAQCVNPLRDGDFENHRLGASSPWVMEGNAGIDHARGFSFRGLNNAWARNNGGWNGIRQQVQLQGGATYRLRGYIRTSANVRTGGYFGYRDASGKVIFEVKFGNRPKYKRLGIRFHPKKTGRYYLFAGFWAPGADAWIQIDNLTLEAPCRDTAGEGVPGD